MRGGGELIMGQWIERGGLSGDSSKRTGIFGGSVYFLLFFYANIAHRRPRRDGVVVYVNLNRSCSNFIGVLSRHT